VATAHAERRPQIAERHPDEPTEPVDYAALNAVWGAMLAALVVASRERGLKHDPISGRELIPISVATFALSKVIAREKIGTWMREPFVDHDDGHGRPRGRRIQRVVGELVTCTRCVGAWSALGIVALRLTNPSAGRVATNVLAASAANDWLQAGFRALTGAANRLNS